MLEVGKEEKAKAVAIQMGVYDDMVKKQDRLLKEIRSDRLKAGKLLLDDLGSVDLMKEMVENFREGKSSGIEEDGDDEFADFVEEDKFVRCYVEVDNKFREAKENLAKMKKKMDELMNRA